MGAANDDFLAGAISVRKVKEQICDAGEKR
jgi:hypothetical protein